MLKRLSFRRGAIVAGGLVGVVLLGEVLAAVGQRHDHIAGLPVPMSLLLQAIEQGTANALLAIGLILIYRATRIINFAHMGFGGVGAIIFFELTFVEHWPYPVAVVLAIAAGAVVGVITELLFIRRFAKSSRLVLTVVTLGVGQLLSAITLAVPALVFRDIRPRTGVPTTPFSRFRWSLFPITLTGNDVVLLVVAVAALAAFIIFFRRTNVGVAIRGAAENDDRASLLGVNTSTLSIYVWGLAAALSATAAVFAVPVQGWSTVSAPSIGSGVLLRALTASVLGGMESLPIAVCSCIGIAIFERSVFAGFHQTAIVDGLLVVLIIGVLLLQRAKLARTDESLSGSWAATEEIRPIPAELASLPSVRSAVRWVLVIGAVVLVGVPWVLSLGQVNSASLFLLYGIVVVSLVVLTGWGGQISLGQFGFVAIGAIVGGSLIGRVHLPFLLALLVGSLAGAASAMAIGLPALRIKGLFLAVTTLAFSIATATVLLNDRYFGSVLPKTITRPKLLWIRLEDERAFYYLCLVGLGLAVFAALGIRRSRTGRVLIAMRENERTAQSFGVNLVRTRLATFAISGFIAAFAGVLFAVHQHGVNQESFGPDQSISIFLMAVIGGLGSVPGALTGALYLGVLNLLSASPFARLLGGSLGLLIILMFFPGGLGAGLFALRDAFLRRVAIRRRIYVPSLMGGITAIEQMAKIVLAPKFDSTGSTASVPVRYRRTSRIRTAGASQQVTRWTY